MVSPSEMEIKNIAALKLNSAAKVRELASHYFMVTGETKEAKGLADSSAAVEVVCSIANVFGVMNGLRNFMPEQAITDLTFALNTNQFWIRNAQYLMPILNSAINASLDGRTQSLETGTLWGNMQYHNKFAWLELLPAIMFCLRGNTEMRRVSLEMKKAFEPLFN